MLELNFSNIEELVFYDKEAQKMLPPSYFSIFEQWRIAKKITALSGIGKQAVLDLLNTLNENDLFMLGEYFKSNVVVQKLNYSVVLNIKVPLKEKTELCKALCDVADFIYFNTWRDEEYLYVSFWR